jgi:DNA-binding transcriptional ArsR family regulator
VPCAYHRQQTIILFVQTDTAAFDPALVGLADTLRALAHPARLALLQVLAERGTCVCGALVDELPLAQSTVSQHLKVLREAGLITGEVEGTKSCYALDAQAVADAAGRFSTLAQALREAPGCSGPGCCG